MHPVYSSLPSPSTTPVLAVEHLSKSYPGVRAVDDVSFAVHPGEVHGLVGENGAGKTTLIKLLAGAVGKDQGQIYFQGRPVAIHSVQDAARLGLAFIHQELNLVPYLNAAENIFLGHPYPRTWFGKIRWQELRRRAQQVLADLGASIPVDVPVRRLSPGQQTMVAIARAFATQATVMVMDEPTATLTDREIERLFAGIQRLLARGVSVIYVSHRLEEIFQIAHRVTVMRNGQVVATQPIQALDQARLIRLMTGRPLEIAFPPSQAQPGEPVLQAVDLQGDRVQGVSFALRRGEVLGVAGLVGAGRSELLRMIFGASPVQAGTLSIRREDGALAPVRPRSPQEAFRLGIALVPEERRSQGLILSRPIFENITLTHLARFARGGFLLHRRRELAEARRLGQALGLKATSLEQRVYQLSGGNQQKVVFARCLAGEARILLLDEPTRGIDVGAKQELYQIIRQLTAQGVAILLVSSELTELLGLADRLLVLHQGRQMALVDAAQVDQEAVLRLCYGVTGDPDRVIG